MFEGDVTEHIARRSPRAATGTFVYRGVPENHPGRTAALAGVATPRGGAATAAQHNLGDTESEFTSWTTEIGIARRYARTNGIVLRVNLADFIGRWEYSQDEFGEGEVLIRGPVHGAVVTTT